MVSYGKTGVVFRIPIEILLSPSNIGYKTKFEEARL